MDQSDQERLVEYHTETSSILSDSASKASHPASGFTHVRIPTSSHLWHIICVVIHLFLVLLHLMLIFVMELRLERTIEIPLGNETRFWTIIIQVSLQLFAVVTLAGALYVSQKLFMQRVLAVPQSLTRSHDQYSSWLGLGSALSALYKQRVARSGILSLAVITLYLACSAILKVTTAALLQLPTTNSTTMFLASSHPIIPPVPQNVSQSNALLPVVMQLALESSDLISQVGLSGNQVYDVIDIVPNATASRTVEVNISTVNVKCYSVDPAVFTGTTKFRGPSLPLSPFSTPSDLWSTKGFISNNDTSASPYTPQLFYFGTFFNVSDSNGGFTNAIPFNNVTFITPSTGGFFRWGHADPAGAIITLTPEDFDETKKKSTTGAGRLELRSGGAHYITVTSYQIGLCSREVEFSTARVNASSRTLVSSNVRKSSSLWSEYPTEDLPNWHNDSIMDVGVLSFPYRDQYFELLGNATVKPDGNVDIQYGVPDRSTTASLWVSFTESFLATRLIADSFDSPIGRGVDGSMQLPDIKLHEIEKAFEDYFAIYLFSRQQSPSHSQLESQVPMISVEVPVDALVSQLTLSPSAVFAGFLASLIMASIAFWIASSTPATPTLVDGVGVLNLLWLSDIHVLNNEGTAEAATGVEDDALRKSGLNTTVQLGAGGLGTLGKRQAYHNSTIDEY
ncbi:hypothetical protein DL96DRAFT_1586103 [Flagelloscypha sp. PMI_526]|nr:hypothetical protein DL96DRAFT_1586103 [Flagelloscypha sp. PMI_526]